MESGRSCVRCGTHYPAHLVHRAFRVRRVLDAYSTQRGQLRTQVCRPCEQVAKDGCKGRNRWAAKARDTIRRHGLRLGIPRDELMGRYGWDPERLAHDAEFQYSNGCGYCGHPYGGMGHGYADITLDVVDRSKPPYYRTNTKWCCQTCNREKGKLPPEEFELNREMWALRERQQACSAQERGMLFDLDETA